MMDAAVYIGRFEPVHQGHLALLRQALAHAPLAIVIVGSAWQSRSAKNPFRWQERQAMLLGALTPEERERVRVVPVRDHYNAPAWAAAVRDAVQHIVGPSARIGLVGHFKDASSYYLRTFPGWQLIDLPRQGRMDATAIRDAYFAATPETAVSALAGMADDIPPSTLGALAQLAASPDYPGLQEEWRMLHSYRAAWAGAPYPPMFITVDALVRCQNQVLLIRRGHAPGKGLLALPGGFLEPRDTLWQSCLRELEEETHCDVSAGSLRAALQSVVVFDHPDRSHRGRTVTHVHYFDLGDRALPSVRADDDAQQVQWTALADLPALEEAFFEDHFHILAQLLSLRPTLTA